MILTRVVIKAGTGNEETGNEEMGKLGNDTELNIVPSRYLDGFGITGKSVFYRTLLNKEHTHSYLDLEQCNLRVLAQ